MEGRWDAGHLALIETMDCDVLLLTEVSERVELPGHDVHLGRLLTSPKRRSAAVASRLPMRPLPDLHGASAMADVDGLRMCSSILPWRSCGSREPWVGATTAGKTIAAVAAIELATPVVWGGDWNHALSGPEWAGSVAGRRSVLESVQRLGLHVPTALSPHQIEGLLSIDHIAVPKAWVVTATQRHRALVGESRISDHDAYVVEADGRRTSDGTERNGTCSGQSRRSVACWRKARHER